jgi:hypothetical protein
MFDRETKTGGRTMTAGRPKMTRSHLGWMENRDRELEAQGGGHRRYRIEQSGSNFVMKGVSGKCQVQFSSGPWETQERAVRSAEELEFQFIDRPVKHYKPRSEKI